MIALPRYYSYSTTRRQSLPYQVFIYQRCPRGARSLFFYIPHSLYFEAEIAFWSLGISYLLHHTVMGFVIGASSLKMNWAAHGALWGALFGLFLAISGIGTYSEPWALFVFPVVWGFLIELLATKAFKQTQQPS